MSYKSGYLGLALPAVLALACVACGGGNQGQPVENQPPPNATVATPMTPPAANPTTPMPPATNATAGNPMGMAAGQPEPFDTLAHGKDFINQADAPAGSWMAMHFAECDTDHDGKVTHTEYDQCTRQAGVPASPATTGM